VAADVRLVRAAFGIIKGDAALFSEAPFGPFRNNELRPLYSSLELIVEVVRGVVGEVSLA
jgi:hypothetical protein